MTPDQILDQFIARASARDVDGFVALFTDDAVMEFPFAGGRFAGRAAIDARLREAWRTSTFVLGAYADVTRVASADAIVAEYVVHGSAGGHPVAVRAVLRLALRDGRIASMREYLDPAGLAAARPPRDVLRRVYAAMQAKSADALADLYAEDAIHEFAFAVPNRPQQLVGREGVRAAYRASWANHPLAIDAVEDALVVPALDPEIVVGQWRARVTVIATNATAAITGLLILRVRAGRIAHCWDYVDAMNIARVLGRAPFATAGG